MISEIQTLPGSFRHNWFLVFLIPFLSPQREGMIRPLTECRPVSGASIGMDADERVQLWQQGLASASHADSLDPLPA